LIVLLIATPLRAPVIIMMVLVIMSGLEITHRVLGGIGMAVFGEVIMMIRMCAVGALAHGSAPTPRSDSLN
jgi:hypothetical protein